MKARVAVLKTAPGTVVDDYGRLMRLAGYSGCLPQDRRTSVTVDISSHVWYPACSTAPWQLDGVVGTLLDDGYNREALDLVANCAVGADDRAAEANNGYICVAEKYGLGFSPPADRVRYEPRAEMMALGEACGGDGIQIPERLIGTNAIRMSTMKAGSFPTGCRHRDDATSHEIMVDLLAIRQEIHSGLFTVMDGTFCADGAMMPFEKDYILASSDQVAIDAVAAKMMGFEPMEIRYIRLAHERGLGCGAIDEIEITGDDISEVDFHFNGDPNGLFSHDRNVVCQAPLQPVERALNHAAGARWTDAASKLCRDYYWFPFIGRPRADQMAEGKWGQLLQNEYLRPGSELENQGMGKGALIGVMAAAALLGMSATVRAARMAGKRGGLS